MRVRANPAYANFRRRQAPRAGDGEAKRDASIWPGAVREWRERAPGTVGAGAEGRERYFLSQEREDFE